MVFWKQFCVKVAFILFFKTLPKSTIDSAAFTVHGRQQNWTMMVKGRSNPHEPKPFAAGLTQDNASKVVSHQKSFTSYTIWNYLIERRSSSDMPSRLRKRRVSRVSSPENAVSSTPTALPFLSANRPLRSRHPPRQLQPVGDVDCSP